MVIVLPLIETIAAPLRAESAGGDHLASALLLMNGSICATRGFAHTGKTAGCTLGRTAKKKV
jgi:hypothetical protein